MLEMTLLTWKIIGSNLKSQTEQKPIQIQGFIQLTCFSGTGCIGHLGNIRNELHFLKKKFKTLTHFLQSLFI